MNRIAFGIADQHLHHGLEPLLEVAAVARAGEHRRHVERVQLGVLEQRLRDLLVDDAQREALGERGLADARLADQQRVVLPPPRQHLDHALELVGAADQRIDLAVARALREVDAEALERVRDLRVFLAVVLDAARPRHDRAAAGVDLRHAVRDVVDDVEPRDALLLEQVDRVRVALAEHRRDHVAGRHLLRGPPPARASPRAGARAGTRASDRGPTPRPRAARRPARRGSARGRRAASRRRRRT